MDTFAKELVHDFGPKLAICGPFNFRHNMLEKNVL